MRDRDVLSTVRERLRTRAQNRPGGASPFVIRNADGATGDTAEVRIYDYIDSWGGAWGISAQEFAEQISAITAPKILVAINSPGGDVFDGIAIYNALRLHSAHITTRVDGLAASIASVIAQAGDHRQVVTGGQVMIHKAWGIVLGNADEMRSYADVLERQDANLAGIYAERTGGDTARFAELMAAETWMTAGEALDEGLVDEIISPVRQDTPDANTVEDRATNKFAEHATKVVTDVEALVARAEEVIAFRADQGKTPLSEDSVEIFDRLQAAIDRLTAANATVSNTTPDDVEAEFLKFVAITQEMTA